MRAAEFLLGEPALQARRVARGRRVELLARGGREARQVERDDAVLGGERLDDGIPHAALAPGAVQEH